MPHNQIYKDATIKLIDRLYMSQRMDFLKIEELKDRIVQLEKEKEHLIKEIDFYKSKII